MSSVPPAGGWKTNLLDQDLVILIREIDKTLADRGVQPLGDLLMGKKPELTDQDGTELKPRACKHCGHVSVRTSMGICGDLDGCGRFQ